MITEREKAILALLFKNGITCTCCDSDDFYRERVGEIVALFGRGEWQKLDLPADDSRDRRLRDIYLFGPPALGPCGKCGEYVGTSAKFCTKCGYAGGDQK